VSVQIVGADPAELAEAAKIVEDHGASLVDLNLGCPVKKVCSTGAGAALLVDPPRVRRIFQAVRKAISCPLTAKIRAGWDEHTLTASEIARIAEEHGVDALTLHARTKTQGFRGLADWDMVLRLKEERRIPIIGNGDVFHPHRAKEVLTRTRCNGIMIGRGARGNPWIFSQTQAYLASGVPTGLPSHNERMHTMLSHLESALLWYGTETGMKRMRQHLAWYVKGLPLANWFRRELHRNADAPSIRSLIEKYFDTLETMHPSACPGGVHPL
jgi:tRNA-dihydrouridine synthase B